MGNNRSPYAGNRRMMSPSPRPQRIRHLIAVDCSYVILDREAVKRARRFPATTIWRRPDRPVATLVAVAVGIQAPGRHPDRIQRDPGGSRPASRGSPQCQRAHRARRPGRRALRPAAALPRGPDHQPNRPGSQCPAQRRSHARGGRTPGRPVLSRARTLRRRGPRGHR